MDPSVINLFISLYKCVATLSLPKPSDDMIHDQTKQHNCHQPILLE